MNAFMGLKTETASSVQYSTSILVFLKRWIPEKVSADGRPCGSQTHAAPALR